MGDGSENFVPFIYSVVDGHDANFLPPRDPGQALLWGFNKYGNILNSEQLDSLYQAINASEMELFLAAIDLEKEGRVAINYDLNTITKQDYGAFEEFFTQVSKG